LSEIDSNDYYLGSQAAVFIDVVQGTTYYIAIYGNENGRGKINLSIGNDATSRISGIITGPDGTTPLGGTDAAAYYKVGEGSETSWEYAHYAITRADGSYTICGLEPDTYRIKFSDYENGAYLTEYCDNALEIRSALDIEVAANTRVPGINASIATASKITGTVTCPNGIAPLSGISVTAYDFDPVSGSWVYSNDTSTLHNGTYELVSLRPGTYRIRFYDYDNNYVNKYYENAEDLDSATSIAVAANTTVSNINTSLGYRHRHWTQWDYPNRRHQYQCFSI
jgi:hypothetical protein